ncbi:MAG TPA: aconitase family protein [Polyangiaceae bacterium]|nr:aconitase family protein [Polyangiaceae bacterium]
MDVEQLKTEGVYGIFAKAGARIEIPGCSLCMGNQARVRDGVTVFSTSTRNFDNRMGRGAKVYLGSSELGAVAAWKGKLPTVDEYFEAVNCLRESSEEVYRYLSFDQIEEYLAPRSVVQIRQ